MFKEWKTLVENQTNKKMKVLRIDNGLECCNKLFSDFCKKARLFRHKTFTETPQQNGLAERMNKTIMDKVRCIMVDSGLSKRFWAEVVATACYLINRSPSSALNFKTLMELWNKKPPSLSHLKPFGCLAYVHVNQGKFNLRALKAVFLGYLIGTKGYKLWLIDDKKCMISKVVVFNESKF